MKQMLRWLLFAICTATYITACILHECLNVCLWWRWPHAFWTKINRIYKLSDVSKETSPIFHAITLASNIMKRHEKIFAQFIQNMSDKKKDNRSCKALCVNTQTQKCAKIFKNICIIITSIQTKDIIWDTLDMLRIKILRFLRN